MQIYCITHKKVDFLEKLHLIPSGVGNNNYPDNYMTEKTGDNIREKKFFIRRVNLSLLVLEK